MQYIKCIKHIFPVGFLLMSMFLTNIVGNYATNRQHRYNDPPLPDILHEIFQPIDPYYLDVALIINSVVAILFIGWHTYKDKTLQYIYKLCFVIGSVYLLRCLCIYVTYLPNSRICTFDSTDNIVTNVRKDFCGDLMYSGHTSQFAVGFLFTYMIYPHKWLGVTGCILSFVYAALISISRLHYTIDVIIALYSTLFLYQSVNKYYDVYHKWVYGV